MNITQDLQFEVHCTLLPSSEAAPIPEGFWEKKITNYDSEGKTVQEYLLHTCRFSSLEQIPWDLKTRYIRFKVERKIAKAMFRAQTTEINEDYFLNPGKSIGIEIHITSAQASEGHVRSSVDSTEHQSLFIERANPLSREELEGFLGQYRTSAIKLYIEAVIYDDNIELDKTWLSACAKS